MGVHVHTVSETQRLRALWALDALDVEVRPTFDLIVELAQRWFDLPMVSITLVDAGRQWRLAFAGPLQRDDVLAGAICPLAMTAAEAFIIDDLTRDPRFADRPYVFAGPRLRFYAGWPLKAPGGEPIGSFCVMDTRPRHFSQAEEDQLTALGRLVERELQLGVRV